MTIASGVPNRRAFLQQVGSGIGLASALQAAPPALIDNAKGNFRFRKGAGKFSSGGTVSTKGYEIVHVAFANLPPLAKGLEMMDAYLKKEHRPPQALCGLELRSPRQFTYAEFGEQSNAYVEHLSKRNLLVDGNNPVARVNVAPELNPPSELSLFGFSYTAPQQGARPSFLGASGELSGTYPEGITARGDISTNGLRQKLSKELGNVDHVLEELGVDWSTVTDFVVFTVHNIHPLVRELLLPRIGAAKNFGIHWYYCRPPIKELEIEIQVRGCSRNLFI
jgi:hypothetical protein